jgi:S1-C subfamily serine protease
MAPRFLAKTDLSGLDTVMLGNAPVIGQYERLVAAIRARVPGAEKLFAEPVQGRADANNQAAPATPTVAWYSEGNSEPQALSVLSPAMRSEAEATLSRVLGALAPVLDDPESGPLLRRALVLADPDNVLVIDGRPILVGWGLAPRGKGGSEAGLAEQLRAVVGRYAAGLAAAGPSFFGAVAGPQLAAGGPPRPAAAAPPPPPTPAMPPPAPPPPPPAAAGASGGGQWWLLPAGLLIAILFLMLGALLAWRLIDRGPTQLNAQLLDDAQTRAQIELQRQTNEALQQEIARARQALEGNICRPEGPLTPGPLQPGQAAPRTPLLPGREPVPPSSVPVPSPPGQPPQPGQPAQPPPQPGQPGQPTQQGQAPQQPREPFRGTLAQLLEQATVLIISRPAQNPQAPQAGGGGGGFGIGTGFFIAPDLVATNAHVTAMAHNGGTILVFNKAFGRAVEAQLVGSTAQGTEAPEPFSPDYTLLRVAPPTPVQPLALANTPERLSEVVASGFPGHVIQADANFEALRRGDTSRVPELVLTTGTISTVQQGPTGMSVIAHTASVSPGNSGGPLVDRCGRVVGVNTFVRRADGAADRVNYSQKAEDLAAFLGQAGAAVTPQADACTAGAPPPPPSATPVAPPAPGTPAAPAAPPPGAPAAPAPGAPATPPSEAAPPARPAPG